MAVPLSWGHIMKGNLATSPPHLFRELLRPSELTLKDPKMYCGFMSQPQALLHLMGGPIAGFLSRPRSRLWGEKKPRGVLESRAQVWSNVMASHWAQAHLEPGSGHRTNCGHGQPWSSSGWSAGNLAFTSSALFALLCPHLGLPRTCFCPPKIQNKIWEDEGSKE